MINVAEKRKCFCKKSRPSYNYEGQNPEYCNDCKKEGMINVVSNKCKCNKVVSYNFPGFAIYYYWFSMNNATNKNMLMKEVIDSFFDNSIDINERKIFFIWANEDWHNNPAFGNDVSLIIKNNYSEENLIKNINNLMKYFKHSNYLKIDNKPVLLLHHPNKLTDYEIKLFDTIILQMCINNKFSGIHLILNSQINNNNNYVQYKCNPNYKQPGYYKSKQIINNLLLTTLDYTKYVEDIVLDENEIQTLFFNFDNRARLFLPNHLDKATVCVNVNKEAQQLFIKKVVNLYKTPKTEINQIMLINSWNEWGEKMATEPSEQLGNYYLDLLKEGLS